MKRWLSALAAWMFVAVPGAALAQNNRAVPDPDGAQIVAELLDAQQTHRGFSRVPALDDWSGPLARGRDRLEQTVELQEGVTYRIVAVCDVNCFDVDMEAIDSEGVRVDRDIALNDTPQLNITPIRTGTFTVRIWWANCSRRPCFVAGRVLRRNQPGDVPTFEAASSGTGFLVSATGLIVTNNHVIGNAEAVAVQFNGENVPATIVARDPANDIALIRAAVTGTPLTIGTAGAAMRGQEVMTLGYPLVEIQGEGQKAAFGRINALTGLQDDIRYMQIDVPVQPGNSGGPLLDQSGAVIGMVSASVNQAMVMRTAGTIAQNVNYAIKADYVLPLIPAEERPALATPSQTTLSFADIAAAAETSVFRIVAE